MIKQGSAEHVEQLLKTHNTSQVAEILNLTQKELNSVTRKLGLFPAELRRMHVKDKLLEMSGLHTYKEMAETVNMSRSAIDQLARKYGINSVFTHAIDPSTRAACEAKMKEWSGTLAYDKMALKLGIGATTVRAWAKPLGVRGAR